MFKQIAWGALLHLEWMVIHCIFSVWPYFTFQESKKPEQIIKGCSEEVTAKAKLPEPLLINGAVQMVNGESSLEPSSPNEQPELSNDQSKNGTKVSRDVSGNLEEMAVKPDAILGYWFEKLGAN